MLNDDAGASAPSKAAEFRQGWKVIFGCFLGLAVGGPSLFYLPAGVFMKAIAADLHVTRTALSGGMLLFTIVTAVASPLTGGITDRFGVRGLVITSLSGVALCFVGFAFLLRSQLSFYILCALCALFGAGSTPLAFTRAVTSWFTRARGLAVGLMLMGSGLTTALVPSIVTKVMAVHGWRGGYLTLAAIVLLALPVIALCVDVKKTEPGPIGPRGVGAAGDGSTALFSLTFWMMLAIFFFLSLGLAGMIVHLVPLLTDAGVTPASAALSAAFIGIAGIAGRIVVGFLVDYLFAPYVAAPVILAAALGSLALALFGVAAAPFTAFAIGLGAGSELELMGYLTTRYFSPKIYGRAYGWQFGAFAIANGFSSLWIAAVHDATGSYQPALYAISAILLLPVALLLLLPRYQ